MLSGRGDTGPTSTEMGILDSAKASPEAGDEPASLAVVILPFLSSQHARYLETKILPSACLARRLPCLDFTHTQSTLL